MKIHKCAFFIAAIAILALAAFPGCSKKHSSDRSSPVTPYDGGGGGSDGGSTDADENGVFTSVNDERATNGVGPLSWCDSLWALAKAHSNDMCARGFFDHVNPEGEGPTDRGRAGHAGSFTFTPCVSNPYGGVAENIAMGYSSVSAVMTGWMNSPGHRANILNSGYTHIGVGICDSCGTHWTQNFGTR
ncbi:MAG: CAP domain-containing protein [Planctomycetota bacterium]|jgi:uncharacterized protein YkwD